MQPSYLCIELKNNDLKNDNSILLNDISRVTLFDDALIEIKIQKDIEFELDDAIRTTNAVEQITQGRRLLHLTIFGERTVPTKEARSFYISEIGSRFKSAEAIVVESLAQKMVFNFMINVESPTVRTKLFTSRDEAIEWLRLQ